MIYRRYQVASSKVHADNRLAKHGPVTIDISGKGGKKPIDVFGIFIFDGIKSENCPQLVVKEFVQSLLCTNSH